MFDCAQRSVRAALIVFWPLSAAMGFAQNTAPVGLVTAAEGAQIRRSGQSALGPTYRGDLLYPGDTLSTKLGAATLSFCPTQSSYAAAGAEVVIEKSRVLIDGKEQHAGRAVSFCDLPNFAFAQQSRLTYTDAARAEAEIQPNIPKMPKAFTTAEQAVLDPIDAHIRADPHDLTTRLTFAVVLEKMAHPDEAARQYAALATEASRAPWITTERLRLLGKEARAESRPARLLAVVVGISRYPRLSDDLQLEYADQDAITFADYLSTSRGRGDAQATEVSLLLNEGATLPAILNAMRTTFAEAHEQDTVVFFVAGHGRVVDKGRNAGAYILASDSNPENPKDTALAMDELEELTTGSLNPKQVQVYVDVCHSGFIGSLNTRKFNRFATKLTDEARPSTAVFGLFASHDNQVSYECLNYRHGAFTYFLLRGLNTAEAADPEFHDITARSLSGFVVDGVKNATTLKQTPVDRGTMDSTASMASPGINGLGPDAGITGVGAGQTRVPEACKVSQGRAVQEPKAQSQVPSDPSDPFNAAMGSGLILPNLPGSAFDMLQQMQRTLNPKDYLAARARLLVALETAGQQIILEYLKGEAVDLQRSDFERGERFFEAAAQLSPEDAFVESRRLFCRGRALLFERARYSEAIDALHDSIRLDPRGAYSYNALGIAFLQTADFQDAIAAFRDAISCAPYWLYARHNLALALTQAGAYGEAIRTYLAAMDLIPHYSYIPYNLGLVYQRLNRFDEAREAWQQALAITPDMARASNAIGLSYFLEGRNKKAEHWYGQALKQATRQTDRLAIRHDMALLFIKRGQSDEAIRYWLLNLAEAPEDLPSLIGVSDALGSAGRTPEALKTLSTIVRQKPDYLGARLRYARALLALGREAQADEQLRTILLQAPENADACELLADIRARNRSSSADLPQATELYQRALKSTESKEQRDRIHRKLQSLGRSS